MKTYILAAGKGTRMNTLLPKSLSLVGNIPLVFHIISKLISDKLFELTIVVGHKGDEVKNEILKKFNNVKFFEQKKLNGTGKAILEILENQKNIGDDFIVMNADDSLFYKVEEIKELINSHKITKAAVSLFLIKDSINRNYRKVILDENLKLQEFTREPQSEGYTVTGLYIFNKNYIYNYLKNYKEKEGEELRITDFMYDKKSKDKINVQIIDQKNWFGINNQEELILANKLYEQK